MYARFNRSSFDQGCYLSLKILHVTEHDRFHMSFQLEGDHLIAQGLLFQSTQTRPYYRLPFKSYRLSNS